MKAFIKLTPQLSCHLMKIGEVTAYAKNETIYSQGGVCQDHMIFYILEGMVMPHRSNSRINGRPSYPCWARGTILQ